MPSIMAITPKQSALETVGAGEVPLLSLLEIAAASAEKALRVVEKFRTGILVSKQLGTDAVQLSNALAAALEEIVQKIGEGGDMAESLENKIDEFSERGNRLDPTEVAAFIEDLLDGTADVKLRGRLGAFARELKDPRQRSFSDIATSVIIAA